MAWNAERTWITGEIMSWRGQSVMIVSRPDHNGLAIIETPDGTMAVRDDELHACEMEAIAEEVAKEVQQGHLVADERGAVEVKAPAQRARVIAAIEHVIARYDKTATAQQRALTVLDDWSLILPQRINTEVLGDFIERINYQALLGANQWKIYVLMCAGIFWSAWYALGEILRQVTGRKAA